MPFSNHFYVNGKVYGKPFDFNTLDKNNDFVFQYDYRSVYDEVLTKWLGSSETITSQILNKRFEAIEGGILARRSSVLLATETPIEPVVYPNPTVDGSIKIQIQFDQNTFISVNQINASRRKIRILENIPVFSGKNEFPLQLIGPPGLHFIELIFGEKKKVCKVVWV